MRSVLSSIVNGRYHSRQVFQSVLLAILGAAVLTVSAVTPVLAAAPAENVPCILQQPGAPSGLQCTANDISLSSPTVTIVEPCSFPGDIAKVKVVVDISGTAQTRYDIGVWMSVDGDPNGDGSETGLCSVLTIPILDEFNNPVVDADGVSVDINSNQCGDVANTAAGPPDILDADMGTVDLLCIDSDGDGLINVPLIITWAQGADTNDCQVSSDALPGAPSKCFADTSVNLEVPIPGRITVDKVTVPSDATNFQFNLSGPASPNEDGFDGSEDFSLNDASPVFDTANFAGGVLEGTYSVTETANPAYTTTISCTGSGGAENPAAILLAPGETVNCVFTNTLNSATIKVVKNTVGGNGIFQVNWDGPTTNGFVSLDTGVINTDTETIVTSEIGTFELQEVVPVGWDLSNAICVNDVGGATVGTWDNIDKISGIVLSPGAAITCTFTNAALGTVTLVKNTVGGNGSFDFVTNVPGLGSNIQTAGGTGQTSASNVPAGTYSIVETVPAGWKLTGAACSDNSPPNALVLAAGETVTCTFTDTADGGIIVDKVTLPAASPQSFTFTPSWGSNFNLTDAATPHLSGFLTPGAYSVSEAPTAGWVLTNVTCIGQPGNVNENPASINLNPGEIVTCVFTNTQNGSIEVVKSLSATGPADQTFGFTSSFNGTFNLTGHNDTTGPIEVAPGGSYTVSEDDPTAKGWANTGASCGDGSNPLTSIGVSPGEAVVCTFTNTPLGSATIIKNTVGGNGIFGFTGDAPIGSFSLDTTDQFTDTTGDMFDYILIDGIYDVTEDNIPANFELTNIGCSDNSVTDVGTATASMNVQLNETVTCTFTNTADGTLIIRKETIPDGAAQGFTFTTGDAVGTIHDYSATQEEIVVSGQPGTYTSAETVPEGWAITDISCTGDVQSDVTIGENDVSVDLAAGETVICTFVNTAQGSITIEKLTRGGVGAFQFNGDFGSFQLDTTGGNPDSASYTNLLPGTYMVSEVVPSNWTLSNIQCSGATNSTITIGGAGGFNPGDQGVTINLVAGESISCRFVNDADGSITVTKATDPSGSAQSFDFTGAITASLTHGQTSTVVKVPPGNYAVTEGAVADWNVTGIVCNDGNSTGTGNTANFVVAPGEVVNCTFTNTIQRGTIIVDKVTDPAGSAQVFQFALTGTGVNQGFALTDAAAPVSNGNLLPTSENGTYNVAETPVAGWTGVGACSDGSPVNAVNLAPGETVTCTFTNTIQRGTIIVDKVTDPAGSAQVFQFALTGTGVNQGFALTDAAAPVSNGNLLPTSENGTYSVAETPVAGWVGEGAVCSDGSPINAVNLAPGEVVTCTFTNIQFGSVTIVKQTDIDGTFQFYFNGPDYGAYLVEITTSGGTGQTSFTNLPPGSYSVSELDPAPFILLSATCDNGDEPDSLTVDAGENITCTFVNGQPIPVPVNSTWALLLLTLMLLATGWYFRPAVMRRF